MATQAERAAAFVSAVADPINVTARALLAYSAVVEPCLTDEASSRRGMSLLARMFFIGPRAEQPEGFDEAARGTYADPSVLYGTDNAQLRDEHFMMYVKVCMISLRLNEPGADAATRAAWVAAITADRATVALDDDEALDVFRARLSEFYAAKRRPPPPVQAAAGGAGNAAGGAAGAVTAHTPKLPVMAKDLSNSQKYRALKEYTFASEFDKTHTTMRDALENYKDDLQEAWSLYLDEQASQRSQLTPAAQVDEFCMAQMITLNPKLFADDDRDEALEFKMTREMDLTQYFRKLKRLLTTAKLSGTAAGMLDPRLDGEARWCKLAVNGLLPNMQRVVKEHLATTSVVPAMAATPGYAADHFTDWGVMVTVVPVLAKASGTDVKRKKKDDEDNSKVSVQLSKSQVRALVKERSAMAASAIAEGDCFEGMAMWAQASGWTDEDGQPACAPCLTVQQASTGKLPLPPIMLLDDGSKAPKSKQFCVKAWHGKPCPSPCPKGYRHMSQQQFAISLTKGELDVKPKDGMPTAQSALVPRDIGSGSDASVTSMASSALTSASAHASQLETLEMRMGGIEQAQKDTMNVLISMSQRLERMPIDAAASRAKEARKESQASRAHIAQLAAENHAKMEAIAARMYQIEEMDTDVSSRTDAVSLDDPLAADFWDQPTVLKDCKAMMAKALRLQSYEESHSQDAKCGQPVARFNLSDKVQIDALMDTGCMPSGLMTWDTFQKLHAQTPTAFTEPTIFEKPKTIAGVGDKVAAVTGATTMSMTVGSRPVIICVGLMTNGNTGMVDVMIGNWHMRHSWAFEIKMLNEEKREWEFVINTPDDGGAPLHLPLAWPSKARKHASPASYSEAVAAFPVFPKPWNADTKQTQFAAAAGVTPSSRGRGRGRHGRRPN